MRARSFLALASSVAALAAPAAAAVRAFPVGGFDRVRTSVPYDVRVHTGAAPSVHATGPQSALDRLDIRVKGGELVIGTVRGWSWNWGWSHERLTIDVTVPGLTGASLSGPGNMAIDRIHGRAFAASVSGPGDIDIGQIDAGHVEMALSGPGNLTAAGRAGSARITLSGPGDVHASRLALDDLVVTLSGPGSIDAFANRTATIDLSGPGDVRIGGRPRCTVHKSGPGSVRCG